VTTRVLLFDVFGTLVDWRSPLIEAATAAGERAGVQAAWPDVVDDWRRAYQPALNQVIGGAAWQDLDTLHARTLDMVLAGHRADLPQAERDALVQGWHRLRPWPDSAEGLEVLRRRHLTATLSNGHLALLAGLMKFAGLRPDVLLSAQLAASYKPAPEVYLTALRLLGCPPEEACMVAAHEGDLRAAAALGLRPAFVARPLEWGPGPGPEKPPADLDGLIVTDSLTGLAAALAAEPGGTGPPGKERDGNA
jgi:2-haloacid dehalogenase